MAMIVSHAPCVNFVAAMMTATTPVAVAPTPLMAVARFQPGSRLARQCTTMPSCDSVKPTNTPTA